MKIFLQDDAQFITWQTFNAAADRPNRPYVIVVGEIADVMKCFVILKEAIYEFNDLVLAIDCAIKIFITFNLKLPDYTAHIWSFFAKYIYELNVGRYLSKVESIVTALDQKKSGRSSNAVPEQS